MNITEFNGFDNQIIREDFIDLYTAMNGKTLREMDQIICKRLTIGTLATPQTL